MRQRQRDLIEVLQFELDFLERGGYGSARTPWKPQSIFQDSLTCLNFANHQSAGRRPCNDCELHRFVPVGSRHELVPCHHIPLNEAGQTLATLDRGNNQEERQEAVIAWLRQTIARLQQERGQPPYSAAG